MDDNRFQLSPRKHATIYEKIERHHFKNTAPADHPQAIILGGQPGAGKSGLLEASKQGFADATSSRSTATSCATTIRNTLPSRRPTSAVLPS
ncbi:MAG: zeta toxin family protein [Burkholderia sp.]